MKAVILAAGEGKRMRPLTLVHAKSMIEVLGKPLLHHVIDTLPREITELIIIIGRKGEQIKKYFGNFFERRKITYIHQPKPLGTGHALHLAKRLIKPGERFLFLFADDLHSGKAIKKLVKKGLGVLVQEHPDPSRFASIETDKYGYIIGFEEKPARPKTNLVPVGVFVFDSSFFDYPMPKSPRGEYEYVDPLRAMAKEKRIVVERTDFWHPIGYPHDIDKAEEILGRGRKKKYDTPVIFLAGGLGTRLPKGKRHLPKVLVDIAGKPMLEHQLEWAKKQGFSDIRLALGYKAEAVIDWLKKRRFNNVKYVVEREPLGTGGGIKLAARGVRVPFIAVNSDNLADFNFASLLRHSGGGKFSVVCGIEVGDVRDYGLIECDEHKRICAFREKNPEARSGIVNTGAYVLRPEDFYGTPKAFSIEKDLFPKLAKRRELVLALHRGNYWFDCGTPERLRTVRSHFAKKH